MTYRQLSPNCSVPTDRSFRRSVRTRQFFTVTLWILLKTSAAAYAGAEVLNASPLPAAAGGAYQELVANIQTNLQVLQTIWSARPAPFLSAVLTNQQAYAQTIAARVE